MIDKNKYKTVLQKRNYDCGVAAVSMLLINSGISIGYKKLEKELKLSKEGVSYAVIAEYVKGFKELKPWEKENASLKDLRSELKKGRLIMVVYQSWGKRHEVEALECGHYSVVVGIKNGKLYMLDPGAYENWGDDIGWRIMDLKEFEKLWIDNDFGKIVNRWMLSVKPVPKLNK